MNPTPPDWTPAIEVSEPHVRVIIVARAIDGTVPAQGRMVAYRELVGGQPVGQVNWRIFMELKRAVLHRTGRASGRRYLSKETRNS